MKLDCPFTLTLPSDLCFLSAARTFVEALCEAARLDRSEVHAVVLASAEAVSNVIRHAHRHVPDAQLTICCRFNTDNLEIFVCDEGDPFDLSKVPHLDPGELRAGGRGVFLMRTLMDQLSCQAQNRGNILHMVKRIQPVSPGFQRG